MDIIKHFTTRRGSYDRRSVLVLNTDRTSHKTDYKDLVTQFLYRELFLDNTPT